MAVLGAAGGGGAISNFPITFAESGTWTCPAVMEAYVFVIGGGGSGAAVAYKEVQREVALFLSSR